MSNNSEKRKTAAKCLVCGTVSAVYVESNGAIVPLGQPDLCSCEEPEVRLIGNGDPPENGRA